MEPFDQKQPRHMQAFAGALCIAAVIFLPFVLRDGGYFIYYGDFNVQQIPFYKLAHEAVRSGDFFWNWHTDLGVNFIGSYSFYLLFSPFFWLTLPFPTDWLPFLMAPLLVLKTAFAALSAYCYLQRFVKKTAYAVLGSWLYAFSGWMLFNVFFNHFHEAAVFFPLLLIGAERLVTEDKKGFFAFAVFLNAMVNYWFFAGEAVFVVLYVIVRTAGGDWPMRPGKFLRIAWEAVLGFGCAAFAVLPSVLALMGNPRTGPEELSNGWYFWLYWHEQRYPAILHSLLFPPELPAYPNFFPDHNARWASLSAWLPLVSLTGVLAYCLRRRRDWLKRMLCLCLLFSLVPGLNSLFILLNSSYYARWFYMPILLMALATVRALEDSGEDPAPFRRSIRWTGLAMALIVVICGLTPRFADGEWGVGLADDPARMWIYAAFAMAGLAATAVLVLRLRQKTWFLHAFSLCTALMTVVFSIYFMASGKNYENTPTLIHTAIQGREQIDLPEEPFARSDVYGAFDNLLMFWHLPNIQAFHSVVPASIMEFYPSVGVKRDVGSRPEAEFYALRPLLSVRWLFIQDDNENQAPMPGYVKHSEQVGYNVYENLNYLPMGFAYDKYLERWQLDLVSKELRGNVLLRAIVLEDESIARSHDLLEQLVIPEDELLILDSTSMSMDVEARRRYTTDSFAVDNTGFTATASFEDDQLVFFSVPWEKGWSASINGEPAVIEKANIGFMAVRVPAGDSVIRFDYMTPGLVTGLKISGACIAVLLLYWVIRRRKTTEEKQDLDVGKALFAGEGASLSWDEFLARYGGRQQAAKAQRAVNEIAGRHIEAALPQEEQTLRFRLEDENLE